MFEQLGQWIAEQWDNLKFIQIIDCYEAGVLLRRGKYAATLPGGDWYFKWPYIDQILTDDVVMTTISLASQKIETKDKRGLVIAAVIKYKIDDIAKYLLEVSDQLDVLSDMPMGIIREVTEDTDYDNLRESDPIIKRKIKAEAKKYGIDVMEVTFTTRAPMRTVMLIHEGIDLGD